MTTDFYLHLRPVGVDGSDSSKTDDEIASQGWWCRSCRNPRPEAEAIDIQLDQARPVISPMDSIGGFGVSICRLDFLESLGKENVANDLMLGKVYAHNGRQIEDWATVRGRHRLIVRGSMKKGFEKHVGSRLCESCGNRLYFAYPPNYLYPAPNPKINIFQSHLDGLIVRPELVAHLNLKPKRGFGIEKLKVLATPRDGLGELVAN